ncbi:hypothetical protein BT96DRAFT_938439 [Gymnopus androsaceus JB14]|uniref:Uncharacterized protein n=1 Tax=Gymnopus androsaceus JB14 TaxID=1447944 RepID=A0A6A4HSS7_9AGAR|nr:hypothetical protein BT96DRAFT_938439 [Gymnopus androsaceus JB14]
MTLLLATSPTPSTPSPASSSTASTAAPTPSPPPTPNSLLQGHDSSDAKIHRGYSSWRFGLEELEMMLFSIYSPVHALLWLAANSSNWIVMLVVMGVAGVQLNALTQSYKLLVKDKEILHAEVHERSIMKA